MLRASAFRNRDLRRLDKLERLFESIRSAPLHEVEQLVRGIRAWSGRFKKDLVVVGPWEGREGNPSILKLLRVSN